MPTTAISQGLGPAHCCQPQLLLPTHKALAINTYNTQRRDCMPTTAVSQGTGPAHSCQPQLLPGTARRLSFGSPAQPSPNQIRGPHWQKNSTSQRDCGNNQ